MAKKINVFITGVSGFIGQKLIECFLRHEDIGTIVGIDVVDPPCFSDKIIFIRHDVRRDMAEVMSRHTIDWAIHAAFVVSVLHDQKLMEEVDINGTKNFLKACEKNGIRHVMQISSTTAYGAHRDNPPLLDEESELRGNDGFTYAKSKAELELTAIKEFRERNKNVYLTVIRPCFLCGPHFYKNPLGRHLMKKIIMLPGDNQPFQFVHEDNVAESVYFLLKNRLRGAYNVAGDGTMTFKEMARMTRGIYFPLPTAIMYPLNNIAWFLRLKFITEFPSLPMDLIRFPWIADNKKLKKAGFTFKYTTKEAYETFAEQVRHYLKRR